MSIRDATAAEDTCIEDGGSAICVGPEVGPFRYQVSNGGDLLVQGTDEAQTTSAFTQLVRDAFQPCTFNVQDNLPPLPPVPPGHGSAQEGDYGAALFQGVGQHWAMSWTISTEIGSQRIPLVYSGTYPAGGSEPCSRSFGPFGAYVHRIHDVDCPGGFTGPFRRNAITEPHSAYCYAAPSNRDPYKNFGKQCTLCANPINGATGNKFQSETDYAAGASSPLAFTRYYNSQITNFYGGGTFGLKSSLGPSWRSSFDRAVRFADSSRFPTVYAYRQDGRTLHFKLANGELVADTDIADRLSRIVNPSGQLIGWKYTIAETDETETYDASGRLTAITSRAGVTQALAYGQNGWLDTVTDSFGRQLQFDYDGNGRLVTLGVPGGGTYSYAYAATGNVSAVTYPDGRVRQYAYNEPMYTENRDFPFALTGIIEESGSRFATFAYNSGGNAVSSEHAGGVQKYVFTYPGAQVFHQVTVTDPLLRQRTYGFSTIQGVARISSSDGACTGCDWPWAAASYDDNGNLSSRTDFNGRQNTYSYDLARNLETSRTEAYGTLSARTITTQWHPTYRLPAQVDEPGKRTTFTRDSHGNVQTRTELDTTTNESRTWTYTYNSFGRVLTADGPRTDVSDVTTYTYYNCTTGYQCGQIATITNAAGHVTTYNTYNAHGQPLTITDPNGLVTTLTYDPRQRLTSRTVGAEQASFEYWPTGLLKKATLPDGSYTQYTYDAAHRLTDIDDSEGNRIHYTLDAMGNRTKEEVFDPSSALSRTSTQVFDTLNRLHQQIDAAGDASVTTTFGYDNNGNQTSISAPLGRNTTQTYDELNRLHTVTDPESGLTTYGYDALDQLISVTDPKGLTTSYTYNALGDLKQQVSPDTGTTTNTYDSGGNLKTRTDARNDIATYEYDELNRVTSATYADQVVGYTYDIGANQNGWLTQVTDNSGSTSWTYDGQGRVVSRQQTMGTLSKSVGYTYDTSGRLQALTLPSGSVITYGYVDGKVASLTFNGSTTLLSNVLYHPFGPTLGWQWGNGTYTIREYDADGRITLIDSAGVATYTYNPDGTIASTTHDSASVAWGPEGSTTFEVSSASNRLVSSSGHLTRTYAYDAAGNVTSDGARSFVYNDMGRMVSATADGVTTTYSYNALGQRVRKLRSGAATYFVYDEVGHLLGEYNSSGELVQELVWLDGIPVATLRRAQNGSIGFFYIHTDHLNTPIRVTRPEDNSVIWRWDRDPFGNGAPDSDPDGNLAQLILNLRFPGQQYDSETGLHYNYQRDYDPATGRYIQSDPLGLMGGINTYVYANANPVKFIDPFGLKTCGSGANEPFVPDNPRSYPFSQCCQRHDDCYGTCGNSRKSCDDGFLECMMNACKKYSGMRIIELDCRRWAGLYYRAVDRHGEDAYKNAQKEACNCRKQ